MLTRLEIENFRCFRALKVEPLKRINLICGKNNSGKTALLEALYALSRQDGYNRLPNPPYPFRPRLANHEDDVSWLFYNKNKGTAIQITGCMEGAPPIRVAAWDKSQKEPGRQGVSPYRHEGSDTLSGHMTDNGLKMIVFPTRPSSPPEDAMSFNLIVLKKKKDRILEMVNQVEPRLLSIESLQIGHETGQTLYADMGLSEMIPMTHLGQGCGRLLNIYAEILAKDADVLLIDEVENGLHHSVLPTVRRRRPASRFLPRPTVGSVFWPPTKRSLTTPTFR
jgi:hypothetical protein